MIDRVLQELDVLKSAFADCEYVEWSGQHWVRIPDYVLPSGWSSQAAEIAFNIPAEAGQPPYGFWVRPALTLESGEVINNCTQGATTPWGSDWMQFSWSPIEWKPKIKVRSGDNMLNFVISFSQRLGELS